MNRVIAAFIAALGIIVFAGNPPDQQKSSISGPVTVANGTSWSTVTIVLRDAGGNNLTGHDWISITSSSPSTSFDPSSATLDGSGTIYTKMRSTTVGNVSVIVTDNTTSTQITGSVLFYTPGTNPPASGSCADSAPGSAPTLTSAVSAGANSVSLTWTGAVAPVTYYLVSYGTSPGIYQYGNPYIGGPAATSYTVGGLTTGTTYYFVIRAVNGCAPGSYSNELAAVAGGAPVATTTPTPTPTPASVPTGNEEAEGVPTTVPTVTPASREQGAFVPTGSPLSPQIPSPPVTFPPAQTQEESPAGIVILIGTLMGVIIIVGIAVWLIIERKNQNRPPPIAY